MQTYHFVSAYEYLKKTNTTELLNFSVDISISYR